MAIVVDMAPKGYLKVFEELRQRHLDLKESAKDTRNRLENKVNTENNEKSGNLDKVLSEEEKKNIWYLEKLLNVLNIQEKLLDNRMNSSFGHFSNDAEGNHQFEGIKNELDKLHDLIQEISKKCACVSVPKPEIKKSEA